MDIFIVDICGNLFEFHSVYRIESLHIEDECILIHFNDEGFSSHEHLFKCIEIVSMEIFV